MVALRGSPRWPRWVLGTGESLVALVVAVPCGYALGYAAVWAIDRFAVPHRPELGSFGHGSLPYVLLTVAGCVVAIMASAWRTLRTPTSELLRNVPPRAQWWRSAAVELSVVALAVAGRDHAARGAPAPRRRRADRARPRRSPRSPWSRPGSSRRSRPRSARGVCVGAGVSASPSARCRSPAGPVSPDCSCCSSRRSASSRTPLQRSMSATRPAPTGPTMEVGAATRALGAADVAAVVADGRPLGRSGRHVRDGGGTRPATGATRAGDHRGGRVPARQGRELAGRLDDDGDAGGERADADRPTRRSRSPARRSR